MRHAGWQATPFDLPPTLPGRPNALIGREASFVAAQAAGHTSPREEIAAYALAPDLSSRVERATPPDARTPIVGPYLTRRERELLPYLAQGLGNQRIADELSLNVRTVEMHVTGILGKLALRNRAQVAARAREHVLPVSEPSRA